MKRLSIFVLAPLVAAASACAGPERELDFSTVGDDLFACLTDCSTDRPFAVGASGLVTIGNSDPAEKISVRLGSAAEGTATLSESFGCRSADSTRKRVVSSPRDCVDDEVAVVDRVVEIVPARAGALTLVVADSDGETIDEVSLEARAPTNVYLVGDAADLPFAPGSQLLLSAGERRTFALRIEDGAGAALYLTGLVGAVRSTDDSTARIVGPTPRAALLDARLLDFDVVAGVVGATNLRVELGGSVFDLPVRVDAASSPM